ncbi:MAG: UDP-N-acetylmuramoyl-L-alanyl-D-glutamate--2,6-diaminopimelate ligase [Acidobacteria bacterium]|jgi:UDP-N-acetylmuramoyl-L-alanyl-D-glutamate--2,6-diaminopimelate ligase|nr:UDP-N-acetylmuramoyl-L-alanyl-D-glutamate--2,6-diaminopimelate ligase [Acidobacteriota bacterium]
MKYLDELLGKHESLAWRGDLHVPVSGIEFDSRRVGRGSCYVAIKGLQQDGVAFVGAAVANGASAVVSVHPPPSEPLPVTWVQVKNDRRALSAMASRFYDDPSRRLQVTGVTGTNGKTTTVALIQALLEGEARTAAIGTLGMNFAGTVRPTKLTTPEAPELFSFMAAALQAGCVHLAMEVSSASLSLHRVDDIAFSQAVFTSFSGDHLDFHGTMENYLEAKLSLFRRLGSDHWAIVNNDDPTGTRVIRELNCRYVTYGFSEQADIRPLKHVFSMDGVRAVLQTPRGKVEFQSRLLGRFNLLNIMAAVSSALVKGVSAERIAAALAGFVPVKGRAHVAHAGDFLVVVDYAHTDDALENLLRAFREIARGRLILVFGAGGSRDKSKRPRMAQVACRHADLVVVTSDNPRQEDPQAIIADITAGFAPGFTAFRTEPDRRAAIALALGLATAGDVVLIAGKGHENYQIFKDRTVHFDDFEVVREVMGERDA